MYQCANNSSHLLYAGVDEAGRGPIAGPVVAAAVILPKQHDLTARGLMDSKALSLKQRVHLYPAILRASVAWAVGVSSAREIDTHNILQASLLAMRRALLSLAVQPEAVLVDGLHSPQYPHAPVHAVVRGDQTVAAISAASVVAKVTRDWLMEKWDECYPGYGFAKHKGYPTAYHCKQLVLGVTPLHRRCFGPVRRQLEKEGVLDVN